jgi:Family of unknown function (DUF6428)
MASFFMTIFELKDILAKNPEKTMRFLLPNGQRIPADFHITEVGHVQKNFVDCGGTVRSQSACVLQAWVATNDKDHRLEAGKLGAILELADKLLGSGNLEVEVEYEAPVISQFPITEGKVTGNELVFTLSLKHTDCLAKESCGLESSACCSSIETSCCS